MKPSPQIDRNSPLLLEETTLTLEEWRRLRDEADVPLFVRPLKEKAA